MEFPLINPWQTPNPVHSVSGTFPQLNYTTIVSCPDPTSKQKKGVINRFGLVKLFKVQAKSKSINFQQVISNSINFWSQLWTKAVWSRYLCACVSTFNSWQFYTCTVIFHVSFHHHSINSYDNIYGEWLNELIPCVHNVNKSNSIEMLGVFRLANN